MADDGDQGDKKRKGKMSEAEDNLSNKKWKGTFKMPWIENPKSLQIDSDEHNKILETGLAEVEDSTLDLSLSLSSAAPTPTPTPCKGKGIIINEDKNTEAAAAATNLVLDQPPVFHDVVLLDMNEGPPVLVFKKELQDLDLDPWLDRLHITHADKLLAFLTQQETTALLDQNQYLTLITTHAQLGGKQYSFHLANGDHGVLYLQNGWKRFVKDKKLVFGDTVHGWGYRSLNEFRLALHIIKNPQPH